jgi:hypothetical protein
MRHAEASPLPAREPLIQPALTLARWQWRLSWRMMMLAGAGMVLAITLVCAAPLVSRVVQTAGLRDAISGQNAIVVDAFTGAPGVAMAQQATDRVASRLTSSFGPALAGSPMLTVTSPDLPLAGRNAGATGTTDHLYLVGLDPAFAGHSVLTPESGGALGVTITPATAAALHVGVGSSLKIAGLPLLAVRIAAITTLDNTAIWQGYALDPQTGGAGTQYEALADDDALLAALGQQGTALSNTTHLEWQAAIDPARVTSDDLSHLSTQAQALTTQLPGALSNDPSIQAPGVRGSFVTAIHSYSLRQGVFALPVALLTVQVIVLALVFIAVIGDVAVERQADALSVLRSRGASQSQITGAVIVQSVLLGIAAIVVGIVLSLLVAWLVAWIVLPAGDRGALNLLTAQPGTSARSIGWLALATGAVASVAMILAGRSAAGLDVLALRREQGRTARRPLWQRWNLDLAAALVGLTGFAIVSLVPNTLDPQSAASFAQVAMLAPLFLLVACALLALRLVPAALRLGAWLASRGRGTAAMLALAQASRAPRRALQSALVLALATGFVVFVLMFAASQDRRAMDVAAYAVGADFSGTLPGNALPDESLGAVTSDYQHIPGVIAVSAGEMAQVTAASDVADIPVTVLAPDADTYLSVALWTPQDADQPIDALMASLRQRRATAGDAVPAYVDSAAWQAFHLTPGATFTLAVPGYSISSMHFVAIGQVSHIPQIYDTSPGATQGGVLVDFQTYAAVYARDLQGQTVTPNMVWLHTRDDASSLASVRAALRQGTLQLNDVGDRRAAVVAQQNDPLRLTLLGIAGLGAATVLMLGIAAAVLAAWTSAQRRTVSLAVLRALGSDRRTIARLFAWEEGAIFAIGVALGLALGLAVGALATPALSFSSLPQVSGNVALFAGLAVPPVVVVLPGAALAALIAGLALAGVATVAAITRAAMRATLGQTLRLNED